MIGTRWVRLKRTKLELKGRSFTRIAGWSRDELETLLDLADELKAERARRPELRVLPGRTIGLIFHKPSTRTRVAFEVGIAELGGMALFLPAAELQLARGESFRDTALVLSRFLSALMIRVHSKDVVRRRHRELVFMRKEQRLQAVHKLRDIRHPHFVGVAMEDVEAESGKHRIAHRILLAKQSFGKRFRPRLIPGAPLIDD